MLSLWLVVSMAERELDFFGVYLSDLMREKLFTCANTLSGTKYDLTSLRLAWGDSPGTGQGLRVDLSYSES